MVVKVGGQDTLGGRSDPGKLGVFILWNGSLRLQYRLPRASVSLNAMGFASEDFWHHNDHHFQP